MRKFFIEETPITDLLVIQRMPMSDERGYLERMFCSEDLKSFFGTRKVVQINHTVTKKSGTIRGMHYQRPPHAEMKLISCLRGEIFDVAVDLRAGSQTFLQWHAEILSEDNHRSFVIPEGFAHGFQTLTDDCELIYLHSASYHPDHDSGLDALDPALKIGWPCRLTDRSMRDLQHPKITSDFSGVSL